MEWAKASVADLQRALSRREISPVELLDRLIGQCDRLNRTINALVSIDPEGALKAARESERRHLAGKPIGVLDGIPVTVKDNLLVRGLPATWGSAAFKDYVPDADELPVERLRSRGAIIFGKTNVPEFTLQGYTSNRVFGPTRNPWDPHLTPGGSSGGAVAAVASGIGPLALATDGGGSVRRPAGFTNLVGLKPSVGRIPREGGFSRILYDLEVVGLVGRSVEDAAMFYRELIGAHLRDRRSWIHWPDDRLATRPIRIRLYTRFGDSPVDPVIVDATEQGASRFESLGVEIRRAEPAFSVPEMSALLDTLFAAGLAHICERIPLRAPESESLGALLERGRRISGSEYSAAIERIWALRNRSEEVFGEADFLVTPTSAAMPWPCETPYPAIIGNATASPRAHAIFTGFVNILGLPAISLPARSTSDGLPIGIQVIARYGEEEALLGLAAAYERGFPWSHEWPSIA